MTSGVSRPKGRRERNKQDKLDRITEAATELFAEHGVDDVTTQQIADRADIGTGTLFLYAKNKGELLLLVQNALYLRAFDEGRAKAALATGSLEAVMALVEPVVRCNRKQIDNGRTYLKEMVFGDPAEPHHAEALAISTRTEHAVAEILRRDERFGPPEAQALARTVSAVMFLAMALNLNVALSPDEVVASIERQIAVLLRD